MSNGSAAVIEDSYFSQMQRFEVKYVDLVILSSQDVN